MSNSLADTGKIKEMKVLSQYPKEPAEIKAGKEIGTIAPPAACTLQNVMVW